MNNTLKQLWSVIGLWLLALSANQAWAAITYVHTDHLGSVIAESNSSGQITKRFHYKPYGESIESQQDDIGYSAHKYDVDIGLSYMQARYYDPVLGRFMSPDPIGIKDQFNLYAYVGNDPVNMVDPTGMKTAVIINGPTSGNPFGHIAIATTGQGVYSFGNNTRLGGSVTAYAEREAPRRNTDVIIINTTSKQEATIINTLKGFPEKLPDRTLGIPDPTDSCSTRSAEALSDAGMVDPFTVGPSFPADVTAQAEVWRQQLGGEIVSIPKNSTEIPESLNEFNPPPPPPEDIQRR